LCDKLLFQQVIPKDENPFSGSSYCNISAFLAVQDRISLLKALLNKLQKLNRLFLSETKIGADCIKTYVSMPLVRAALGFAAQS
jgi:hypothetical protein